MWHPSKSHFPPAGVQTADSMCCLCVCVCVREKQKGEIQRATEWETSHTCLVTDDNLNSHLISGRSDSCAFDSNTLFLVCFSCQPLTHLMFQPVPITWSTLICTPAPHSLITLPVYITTCCLRKRASDEVKLPVRAVFFFFFNLHAVNCLYLFVSQLQQHFVLSAFCYLLLFFHFYLYLPSGYWVLYFILLWTWLFIFVDSTWSHWHENCHEAARAKNPFRKEDRQHLKRSLWCWISGKL